MLVLPESSLAVLVMMNSMSEPMCNRFHARQTNIGKKLNDFMELLLFDASV